VHPTKRALIWVFGDEADWCLVCPAITCDMARKSPEESVPFHNLKVSFEQEVIIKY
jgi:hypothetical protein